MSSNNEIEQKCFHYYHALPSELRILVIDEMLPSDRCRFTRCSKLCNKEAKASNNYIYSLSMYASFNLLCITVAYSDPDMYPNQARGYCLEYNDRRGTKTMIYRFLNRRVICQQRDFDSSTNLHTHCADHFKQLLQQYQDKVKCLSFSGFSFRNRLRNYDFGIENLNKVQYLFIAVGLDSYPIVSSLRKPLKRLVVGSYVENCSQIYQVEEDINLSDSQLTYEEMMQLSAPNVEMVTGHLTEENIHHFITSWQDGTMEKNIQQYKWVDLRNSNFDLAKFLGFFGRQIGPFERIEIPLKRKDGKVAKLSYDPHYPTITFQVENDE